LIHDWLVEFGGAEQILAALFEIWPQAPVYTMIFDPAGQCSDLVSGHTVTPSALQQLPGARRYHRRLLPLMPLAVEQFDLRSYNLLISISYAVAHGVLTQPDQLHINYICTPVRYAWHLYFQYLEEGQLRRGVKSWLARSILHYLRLWDVAAANRVDHFVAISHWVAQNVWRVYRRNAEVIYPPVDIEAFEPTAAKEDYYLVVSRLVPYKKVDLIVDVFSQIPDKRLVIIGDGPDMPKLREHAARNVEFLGYQPVDTVRETMQHARAFIIAAEEDFGITAVEAQASGTPVIALPKVGRLRPLSKVKLVCFSSNRQSRAWNGHSTGSKSCPGLTWAPCARMPNVLAKNDSSGSSTSWWIGNGTNFPRYLIGVAQLEVNRARTTSTPRNKLERKKRLMITHIPFL
jgi:hypothetical protein